MIQIGLQPLDFAHDVSGARLNISASDHSRIACGDQMIGQLARAGAEFQQIAA
jgi:hypothetical protein